MNERRPVYVVLETGSLAGGVRVLGEFCNRLVRRGWTVEVWSPNMRESMGWFELDRQIKWRSFYRTGNTDDYQPLLDLLSKQSGIKLATFWRTAPIVNEASKSGEGYYLVQDVETVYGGYPILDAAIEATYTMPLRKVTTSRWVEKQLPDTLYVGLGVDSFWRTRDGIQRKNFPLACARRQALKGWGELCEVCRYLTVQGKTLTTFGLDAKSPMVGKFTHYGPKIDESRKTMTVVSDRSIRDLYAQAGCFISTSVHEGFSLTPIEAMGCGTPVVMTNADGNMEYAEDGVNCLIGADPQDICDKTIEVLKNRKLAASLAKNGAEIPRRYKWEDAVTRLENSLMEL